MGSRTVVVWLLAGFAVCAASRGDAQSAGAAPVPAVAHPYAQLPLAFTPNEGQAPPDVRFIAPGPHRAVALTATETTFALDDGTARATLRMAFTGANRAPQISGVDELPGKANYFIGRDPAQWRTNVPTYAKVRYEDIYPGVDVVYYGTDRQLEYDLVVRPGSRADGIALEFSGADRLEVDADGDLLVHTRVGVVRHRKPIAYQDVHGVKTPVSAEFRIRGRHVAAIRLGPYDRNRALTIDPTIVYATYVGGSGGDEANAIAVGPDGSAYITGYTYMTNSLVANDFPITGGLQLTPGNGSVFVSKLNPAGTALEYSTLLGGSGGDSGYGIAVDAAGHAWVTGQARSRNFPVTGAAVRSAPCTSSCSDAFVAKLDPSGSALLYSTYLGSAGTFASNTGQAIAVDSQGSAYVTGITASASGAGPSDLFPTTPGAFQSTAVSGAQHAFVAKFTAAGTLTYATYLAGKSIDGGYGIAVDASGSAYVAGQTQSPDFPTTPGAFQTSVPVDCTDAFVSKLSPDGSSLVYSTFLSGHWHPGGSGNGCDSATSVAVDASGHAYVAGYTGSDNFPTTAGAFQTTYRARYDAAFVTKLAIDGSALAYSTYLGGSFFASAQGIAVDAAGRAYVTGYSESSDFPSTGAPFAAGTNNVFVTVFDPTGSSLVYSIPIVADVGWGIALDATGAAYVAGDTYDGFPATPGAVQTTFGGTFDAFVVKVAAAAPPPGTLVQQAGVEYRAQDSNGVPQPVYVTFGSVNQPGRLIADVMTDPPAPPAGYAFLHRVYDVHVEPAGSVSGPIDVCIEGSFAPTLVFFHYESSAWVDRTVSRSATRMCARVDSLSPFGPGTPAVVLTPRNGGSVSGTATVINNGPGDQTDPHVSGDLVVYTAGVTPQTIRYFRFSTGTDAAIPSPADSSDSLSDLSGDLITFTRMEGGCDRIIVFDTTTGATTEVAAAGCPQRFGAAIGNTTVAFVDFSSGPGAILAADATGGPPVQLSGNGNRAENPEVSPSGDLVVWEECSADLLVCDVIEAVRTAGVWGPPEPIALASYNPDTDGTNVVYDSNRPGNATAADIYFQPLDGSREMQLQLSGGQVNPSISRGIIAFESTAPGAVNADIFIYVIATNTLYQVTNTPYVNEQLNDVSVLPNGDVRVVWAANDGALGDYNVYAATFRLAAATTLTLAPVVVGTSNTVTLTATLASSSTPVGRQITFSVEGQVFGPVNTDANGVATLDGVSLAAFAPGTYPGAIQASFTGDVEFAASSASADLVIPKAATTVTLTATPNPSTFGQDLLFGITLSSAFGLPPGPVEVRIPFQNQVFRFSVGLIYNVAAFTLPFHLPPGTTTVSVVYGETAQYFGSSAQVDVTVNPASTITTLSSSRNPSLTTAPPVFTATVSAPDAPNVPIDGKVDFMLEGMPLCRATVFALNGAYLARCGGAAIPSFAGPHQIVAMYLGNAAFVGSSSAPIQQQIDHGTYTPIDLASNTWVSSTATGISENGRIVLNYDVVDRNGVRTQASRLLNPPDLVTPSSPAAVDLGSLGGVETAGASVNSTGKVVGAALTAANAFHAFLFTDHLADISGGASSFGERINDSGLAIGVAAVGGSAHAVSWPNGGTMTDLQTLGGTASVPFALSETGLIVGRAQRADGVWRAVRFTDGPPADLGTLGGDASEAYAVNNAGEIAGVADVNTLATATRVIRHAFMSDGFVMTDIGTLPDSIGSDAAAINDAGDIAGTDTWTTGCTTDLECTQNQKAFVAYRRAFLYSNGNTTAIGGISSDGVVRAISNAGMIIGTSAGQAFAAGGVTLGPLPTQHAYPLSEALAINDAGQIVGWEGATTSARRATLWVPVPTSTLTVAPASAMKDTAVNLSARLQSLGGPVAGRLVTFGIDGNPVGSAPTDASGIAVLPHASVAGLAVGIHPNGIMAIFDGDMSGGPSTATADLTVTPPLPTWVRPIVANVSDSPVAPISTAPGSQLDPHVSGDLVSYVEVLNGVRSVRYAQLSAGSNVLLASVPDNVTDGTDTSTAVVSEVSGTRVVFSWNEASQDSNVPSVNQTSLLDTVTSTTSALSTLTSPGGSFAYLEFDSLKHAGAAVGGDTAAFFEWPQGGAGRVVAVNLRATDPATARQTIFTTASYLSSIHVSPDGGVIVWTEHTSPLDPVPQSTVHKAIWNNGAWQVSRVADNAAAPDTDGTWIVYNSFSSPNVDVCFQSATGSNQTCLDLQFGSSNPSISRGTIVFQNSTDLDPVGVSAYVIASNRLYQVTSTPDVPDVHPDVDVRDNGDIRVVWVAEDGPVIGPYQRETNIYTRLLQGVPLGAIAPANDAFANAMPLNGPTGETPVYTLNATREPGEPNHAGSTGFASVWYRWVAPADGVFTISVAGTASNPLLAVYSGTAVSSLTPLGSNTLAQPFTRVPVNVVSGGTYYIAVDGADGEIFEGALSLQWGFSGGGINAVTGDVASGGTVITGAGATPLDPITTSVTSPMPGTVSIVEGAATTTESGFTVLDQQVSITAPAASASSPLVIVFELDASLIPAGRTRVYVYRNGAPVATCTKPAVTVANPDPCIQSEQLLANGNLRITILTSHASLWTFFVNFEPELTLPSNITAEATGPNGAAVTFAASATDREDGPLTPICAPASGSIFALGVTTVTCAATDSQGATTSGTFSITVRDTTPPTVAIAAPAQGAVYLLAQSVTAAYTCTDLVGVASCAGPVTSGGSVDTATVGGKTFVVTGTDTSGNTATASVAYQVTYDVRLLYDATKAVKSGSTLPLKIALVDAAGVNRSSSGIVVTATTLERVGDASTLDVLDSGNANPDSDFRFDATLGGYIFNLSTKGLTTGQYAVTFIAAGDPVTHAARFLVR